MQPPQQSMGTQQPYYGYQQPAPAQPMAPMMINKRLIFLGIAIGVLLIWVAELGVRAFVIRDTGLLQLMAALYYTGAGFGLLSTTLGALGSPRTDGHQNTGLLVLAGFFVLALVGGV